MQDGKELTLKRILWTDYTAYALAMLVVGFWLAILVLLFTRQGAPDLLYYLAIAATVFALVGISLRFKQLQRIFQADQQADGLVERVWFMRDRGRVEFSYTFQGEKYLSASSLHRTKETLAIQIGDKITLVVDPKRPRRAYVRHLYMQ